MKSIFLYCCFFSILSFKKDTSQQIQELLSESLRNNIFDHQNFEKIVSLGTKNGIFSPFEFYSAIHYLSAMYPRFFTSMASIGSSIQKNDIKAFRVGRIGFFKRRWNLTKRIHYDRRRSWCE